METRIDNRTLENLQRMLGGDVPQPVQDMAAAVKQRLSTVAGTAPLSLDVCALICVLQQEKLPTARVSKDADEVLGKLDSEPEQVGPLDWSMVPEGASVVVAGENAEIPGVFDSVRSTGKLRVKLKGDTRKHRDVAPSSVTLAE